MTKYGGKPPYQFKVGDNKTGQCSECGEVFYGEKSFSDHRRDSGSDRICIDPATDDSGKLPWWKDDHGRWHHSNRMTPQELARRSGQIAPPNGADTHHYEGGGTSGGSDPQEPPEPKPSGVPQD